MTDWESVRSTAEDCAELGESAHEENDLTRRELCDRVNVLYAKIAELQCILCGVFESLPPDAKAKVLSEVQAFLAREQRNAGL